MTAIDADQRFFQALQRADVPALEALLAADFLMIDVMRGGEISRAELIGAVGSGLITFTEIVAAEVRVRSYGATAVVTGRTEMHGRVREEPWRARSRYTHVYVDFESRWQLVSAQGTPIAVP